MKKVQYVSRALLLTSLGLVSCFRFLISENEESGVKRPVWSLLDLTFHLFWYAAEAIYNFKTMF